MNNILFQQLVLNLFHDIAYLLYYATLKYTYDETVLIIGVLIPIERY